MQQPPTDTAWALIYNPAAGSYRPDRLEAVVRALEGEGLRVERLPTAAPMHAAELAQAARGVHTIAVLGGDGTLNEAAQGMMRRTDDVPLAFLPGGTANVMAIAQGLPMQPERAAILLARGRVAPVFPGIVAGRYFLLMAGVGFDAFVIHRLNLKLKRALGRHAYTLSGFKSMFAKLPAITLMTEGQSPLRCTWAVLSLGRYYGGRNMLHANGGLEAGTLTTMALHPAHTPRLLLRSLWYRLRDWWRPARQGAWPAPVGAWVTGPGAEVRVETKEPVYIQIDGDLLGAERDLTVGLSEKPLMLRFPARD